MEDERISISFDRKKDGKPRELRSRFRSNLPSRLRDRPGAPPLWFASDVYEGDPLDDGLDIWGRYPRGFVAWAAVWLGVPRTHVLHVCSGSIRPGDGVRVDIRGSMRPDVVADGRSLPFADSSIAAVLMDPPYTVEYAKDLYGHGIPAHLEGREEVYPRPSHLMKEALRVLEPCGRMGLLHFLVPRTPEGCDLVAVRGVTQGGGYRIRAFTVFQKHQATLFDGTL